MIEDEGYELAKALLMMHQKLYAPVWWDQPPVHAGILHTGAVLLGSGVQSFRLVAGFLCAASLWALAACASPVRRREGGSGLMSGSGESGCLPSAALFLPHPGPLPLGEGEAQAEACDYEGMGGADGSGEERGRCDNSGNPPPDLGGYGSRGYFDCSLNSPLLPLEAL